MQQIDAARPVTLSLLRKTPGAYIDAVAHRNKRFLIYSHRREVAALVRVADLYALERAQTQATKLRMNDMAETLSLHHLLRQALGGVD